MCESLLLLFNFLCHFVCQEFEHLNLDILNAAFTVHDRVTYKQFPVISSHLKLPFSLTQVVDNHGFTPLICACFESHSDCVKLLLAEVGCLVSIRLRSSHAPDARHPSALVCVGGHGC